MEYLLDTDWIIHALAGEKKTLATLELLQPARIAVS
jgi:predicted nucleic acid-binding protein